MRCWISSTTAIVASLATVGSLRAGAPVDEALLIQTEVRQPRAQAWIATAVRTHDAQADSISRGADPNERERDERNHAADVVRGQHERLAYAVALFQIAIALAAVAAPNRVRAVWVVSLALGAAGLLSLAVHARGGAP